MHLDDFNTNLTAKKLNQLLREHFELSLPLSKLSVNKAHKFRRIVSEKLNSLRNSTTFHNSEQDPRYMTLLLTEQLLNQWIIENKFKTFTPKSNSVLVEAQTDQAEVILATRDLVDRLQSMVEDVGKMLNEELPELSDRMRDVFDPDQTGQFVNSAKEILSATLETLTTSREQMDTASRTAAGEEVTEPMTMGDEVPDEMPAELSGEDDEEPTPETEPRETRDSETDEGE